MVLYLSYMASPIIIYLVMSLMKKKPILSDERLNKRFLIICGITMFLMIGLRNPDVGSGDSRFYYENWESMSGVSWSYLKIIFGTIDMEKGYLLSVWFLSHIFPNPQMLFVFTGAFFSLSVCRFVSKNSENALLSIVVFNCLGLFNFMVQGLRQSVAMCICLWAIEQCKKKHFIKFILLVTLATLFHASAVVFVVVWFVSMLKIDFKSILIFVICTSIALLFLPQIFNTINEFINDDYAIGNQAEQGGFVAILIYMVILGFAFLYGREIKSKYSIFLYITIIGFVTFILRNTTSAILERVSFYFAFGQMVLLPNSINSVTDGRNKFIYNALAIILCLGVAFYKSTYAEVVPYNLFWMG